ncbi:MAG: hypothetical protein ACE5FI_15790 [Anaerolineales bacterium]
MALADHVPIVGAPFADAGGTPDSGRVYLSTAADAVVGTTPETVEPQPIPVQIELSGSSRTGMLISPGASEAAEAFKSRDKVGSVVIAGGAPRLLPLAAIVALAAAVFATLTTLAIVLLALAGRPNEALPDHGFT